MFSDVFFALPMPPFCCKQQSLEVPGGSLDQGPFREFTPRRHFFAAEMPTKIEWLDQTV
jgi:hypothetical protein